MNNGNGLIDIPEIAKLETDLKLWQYIRTQAGIYYGVVAGPSGVSLIQDKETLYLTRIFEIVPQVGVTPQGQVVRNNIVLPGPLGLDVIVPFRRALILIEMSFDKLPKDMSAGLLKTADEIFTKERAAQANLVLAGSMPAGGRPT